jgi:hypothetical protein
MSNRVKLVNGDNSIVVWKDQIEALAKKGWLEEKPRAPKKAKVTEIVELTEESEV